MRKGNVGLVLIIHAALPFFLLLNFFVFPSRSEAEGSSYIDRLLEKADQLQLYKDPYWETLLHYKIGLRGRWSQVDDPKFFLSAKGKHDPQAELEASLVSFFKPMENEREHAVCRFVGRFHWLKEKLDIDEQELPLSRCEPFESLYASLNSANVSLIFATAYMNRPASMFGHTFITIDTAEGRKLLSNAINYSAITGSDPGPLYALKGLVGAYPGYFSLLPYYSKIQQYSDIEHRNMWEYRLTLTQPEIRRLVMHAYELDLVYSDYYFFDENCSYTLLYLLDAARPGLRLTHKAGLWVIPLDTIRLARSAGIIHEIVYRPSKTTELVHMSNFLNPKNRKLAHDIAWGHRGVDSPEVLELRPGERATVIDLSTEYLQYLYSKRIVDKDAFQKRLLSALARRSGLESDFSAIENPPGIPPNPEDGHKSSRISISSGLRKDDLFFELSYRPVYHSLLDPSPGYEAGAQIIFAETVVRYEPEEERLNLEALNLIDIVSLSPRGLYFRPVSWKVNTGFYNRMLPGGKDHMVYALNPGGGLSWKVPWLGIGFVMLETDIQVGGALEENYAWGAGGSAGFLTPVCEKWTILAVVRDIYYGLGDKHNNLKFALGQGFSFTANWGIQVELSQTVVGDLPSTEAMVRFNAYF